MPRGPRTLSRTSDADLDCAFVENALPFVAPKIERARPHPFTTPMIVRSVFWLGNWLFDPTWGYCSSRWREWTSTPKLATWSPRSLKSWRKCVRRWWGRSTPRAMPESQSTQNQTPSSNQVSPVHLKALAQPAVGETVRRLGKRKISSPSRRWRPLGLAC